MAQRQICQWVLTRINIFYGQRKLYKMKISHFKDYIVYYDLWEHFGTYLVVIRGCK